MLDINYIRENTQKVVEGLKKKGWDVNFDQVFEWNDHRKEIIAKVEQLKAEKNKLSASVPAVKKQGGNVEEIFTKVKHLNETIETMDTELKEVEDKIFNFMSELPNVPDEDLLPGEKENNKAIYTFGKKPEFDFEPKNHVDLCESLGLIDYARASKLSGRGTWIYTGLGARLEWAILNFLVSEHLKAGYEFILPPHILNEESGYCAGQFPKFKEDVFWLEGEEPRKFILPTAETALVNLYRDEIINEDELPKKFFAYTPCYRKE